MNEGISTGTGFCEPVLRAWSADLLYSLSILIQIQKFDYLTVHLLFSP